MLDQLRDPNSELNVIIDSRYAANDGDTTIINLPITVITVEQLWRVKCNEAGLSPEETEWIVQLAIAGIGTPLSTKRIEPINT